MIEKKIAIAVENPEIYSQTFVLRHINELAGGRTAVIIIKLKKLVKINKPIFVYHKTNSFFIKTLRMLSSLLKLKSFNEKKRLDEELKKFIKKENVCCVLAEFGYVGVRIYDAVLQNNIPMFCYFRGADASRKLAEKEYVTKLKTMMPRIHGIFAVSQSLVNNLRIVGVEHPNTHVIPSGVDTKLFIPGSKDPNLILAVGRFTEKKAPHITIQAFAKAYQKHPNIRLEMIGDGELLEMCINLAQDLGISESVTFHGAQNHDFVKTMLSKTSIFLQHSITASNGDTEGMPTAIQEAMSSGCIVISTHHAGIPEHIKNGVNGMIVEEGNLNAYIQALTEVLENNQFKIIAKNARNHAIKHFDYKTNYARLEKLIFQ